MRVEMGRGKKSGASGLKGKERKVKSFAWKKGKTSGSKEKGRNGREKNRL